MKRTTFIQGAGTHGFINEESISLNAKGLYAVLNAMSNKANGSKPLLDVEVFDMLCHVLQLAIDNGETLYSFKELIAKHFIDANKEG